MSIERSEFSQFVWIPGSMGTLCETLDAQELLAGWCTENWATLEMLGGNVREGLRASAAQDLPDFLYRPSHIQEMTVIPDRHRWSPQLAPRQAVGPGDVVVSKFLPLRAGWITPSTPRHTVDSNCLRVIGLSHASGFWVSAVLNHPAFASRLMRRSKGKVVARIGMRELKNLRVPGVPQELEGIAETWQELEVDRASFIKEVHSLIQEAQGRTDASGPSVPGENLLGFVPPMDFDGSWLLSHILLRRYQRELGARGWPRIGQWMDRSPRRLRGKAVEGGRLLQLSDAEVEMGFRLPKAGLFKVPRARIYADALQPGEVLLSLLGSSPKVIFNCPAVQETVWVSDHWVRLGISPRSGPLVLGLLTAQVQWQLRRASTGSVQQFITLEAIAEVRIPSFDAAATDRLQARLSRALEGLASVRAKQALLRKEVNRLIDRHMGGTQ